MGRLTLTQRILAKNAAERKINQLRREGKPVPPDLAAKLTWNRKIKRRHL